MPIYAYKNVSKKEIKAQRFTSEGRSYTLNHPDELVISMRYKGKGMSTANSQGWERNSDYYFKELSNRHPEFFSKKNTSRIQKGESPLVDKKFCEYFPQYEGFKNEVLMVANDNTLLNNIFIKEYMNTGRNSAESTIKSATSTIIENNELINSYKQ